jgi:hypothetical protein
MSSPDSSGILFLASLARKRYKRIAGIASETIKRESFYFTQKHKKTASLTKGGF